MKLGIWRSRTDLTFVTSNSHHTLRKGSKYLKIFLKMILNESQAIWLLLFIKQHVSTIGWKSSSGFLNNSLKIIKDIKRIIQNNIGTEINCVLWSSLSITIFPLSITIFIVMFNLHFNNNKQKAHNYYTLYRFIEYITQWY